MKMNQITKNKKITAKQVKYDSTLISKQTSSAECLWC